MDKSDAENITLWGHVYPRIKGFPSFVSRLNDSTSPTTLPTRFTRSSLSLSKPFCSRICPKSCSSSIFHQRHYSKAPDFRSPCTTDKAPGRSRHAEQVLPGKGSFEKDIFLGFEISFFIQNFNGRNEGIAAVFSECPAVGGAVQKPMPLRKGVVGEVQIFLCLCDGFIRRILHLSENDGFQPFRKQQIALYSLLAVLRHGLFYKK